MVLQPARRIHARSIGDRAITEVCYLQGLGLLLVGRGVGFLFFGIILS